MAYAILEGNMERLEKKLARIANKCRAYGCSFRYEKVGEIYKQVKDEEDRLVTAKFILVEAEGTAAVEGWELVASIDHTENGNIFTGASGIEIPARYYYAAPVCEHCNVSRYRKYTYLVRNTKTGEFKQVGKSCLKDFTGGLSAEMAAQYLSLYENLVKGEAPELGSHYEAYVEKEEYLCYVAEAIKHFGYSKKTETLPGTAQKAMEFYRADMEPERARPEVLQEMGAVGFDAKTPENQKKVAQALGWIAAHPESNAYYHNLRTACSLEYVKEEHLGLTASLFQAYAREMRDRFGNMAKFNSAHVGKVGDMVSLTIKSVRCITSWENVYGTTRVYEIIGTDGNVYTWKTQKILDGTHEGKCLSGTVKAHNLYKGIRQTEVTYCHVAA